VVEKRTTDGVRIGELLASELTGGGGPLASVAVVDADPAVEPTADGARAFRVTANGEPVATAYAHPDRLRIEFRARPERAARAAAADDLRVRPKAVDPPRTIVFVPDGASVKPARDVFEAVVGGG
jgi:hypothetical protein